MPNASCTLVGIISLPHGPCGRTSHTDYPRTDDLHLADTLARLAGKASVAVDRLNDVDRSSRLQSASSRRGLVHHCESRRGSTMIVRANVERLESQLHQQTDSLRSQIENARI